MNIAEMHVAFRQYAQQMGMQNVRAILPEQIDILLNQSIMDTVNQLIRENIGVTNDRVITDNSKIGQINAFRTLYKVKEVSLTEEFVISPTSKCEILKCFTYNTADRLRGLIKHTFDDSKDDGSSGDDVSNNESIDESVAPKEDSVFGKYMFLIDISINYTAKTGADEAIITSWYPVRIIDSAYLADSLNDFILKNRFRSPIGCVYSNDTLELYIDKFNKFTFDESVIDSQLRNNGMYLAPYVKQGSTILTPHALRIDLISYPAIVRYASDIQDSENAGQDCDLPSNMHGDIVKHAVDLYRVALNGSLQSQQEAEQAQQRENLRNNYRNEGN